MIRQAVAVEGFVDIRADGVNINGRHQNDPPGLDRRQVSQQPVDSLAVFFRRFICPPFRRADARDDQQVVRLSTNLFDIRRAVEVIKRMLPEEIRTDESGIANKTGSRQNKGT